MTITLQLSAEQAAVLQEQAAEEGLTVDAWLQRLAEQQAQPRSSPSASGQRPIWETITERMNSLPEDVFDRLPSDGASEHDHYLYGSPKRDQ